MIRQRLTDDQISRLKTAKDTGTRNPELARRFGISEKAVIDYYYNRRPLRPRRRQGQFRREVLAMIPATTGAICKALQSTNSAVLCCLHRLVADGLVNPPHARGKEWTLNQGDL